ncbi:diaminopimelate epimerase [Candidatus Electrothrix marina]|uniref:Diaminopimelate epimerase n=1 Tax=Candidatus Electrothrix marina TaxID=1859130 RepID=A0A444JGB5_9BACT|nr:diaminopimelate epimerase [Candidatus Electrothrix marina]
MQTPDFPVPFVKMSGTGNDFIIIDHRKPLLAPEAMAEFAAKVCRRKFSAGADGLILIEDSSEADFQWQFFNADGSVAEMCGNGARCAARFAFLQGIAPAHMRFATLAGIIEASVSAKDVAVKMTDPVGLNIHQRIMAEGKEYTVHSIDTGVPHAVLFVDDIDQADVRALGSLIRHHEAFMPGGTNVNFVQRQGDAIKVRTYERGVEDETLACGTGAAASAIIAAFLDQAASPVDIITSGNDRLTILFDRKEDKVSGRDDIVYNVFLKGLAHTIYSGALDAEALL